MFVLTIIHVSSHFVFLSICLSVQIFVISTLMGGGGGYTHIHTQMLNVDITHVSACACI